MCGIAGAVLPGQPASRLAGPLDRMVAAMVHRGPDDAGALVHDGVALGMRRLSIIDLAGGHQPIANESSTNWVVQNGEIYNFRSLRQELQANGHSFRTASDTEVLVHAYEQWGDRFVDRLNGMFALAIWDEPRQRLLLARDRFGIKPLYWARTRDGLLFASELKALMASSLVEPAIDDVAVRQFLLFEHVPAPRSVWRDVQKLEAGTTLVFEGGDVVTKRYWSLQFEPNRSGTYQDAVARLSAAVDRAVALELVSDVPIGVLLSGGVDSSGVALAACRAAGQIDTFTVGMDDPSFDESSFARDVAHALGTHHHETLVGASDLASLLTAVVGGFDEPFADSSVLPTYLLARFARETVTVALGGDGGDELFGGYPTYNAHRVARLYRVLPGSLRSLVSSGIDRLPTSFDNISLDFRAKRFVSGYEYPPTIQHQIWLGGWTPAGIRQLCGEADENALFEPVHRLAPLIREMEPLDRMFFLDAQLYMQGILTKTDRASMRCSLEVRVPLLNNEVVEEARLIPWEWKLRRLRTKAVLRDAVAPGLPPHIRRRPKKGFNVPIAKWLRSSHAGLLHDLVDQPFPQFDAALVRNLVHEHLAGSHDHRKKLWPLVALRSWERHWTNTRGDNMTWVA